MDRFGPPFRAVLVATVLLLVTSSCTGGGDSSSESSVATTTTTSATSVDLTPASGVFEWRGEVSVADNGSAAAPLARYDLVVDNDSGIHSSTVDFGDGLSMITVGDTDKLFFATDGSEWLRVDPDRLPILTGAAVEGTVEWTSQVVEGGETYEISGAAGMSTDRSGLVVVSIQETWHDAVGPVRVSTTSVLYAADGTEITLHDRRARVATESSAILPRLPSSSVPVEVLFGDGPRAPSFDRGTRTAPIQSFLPPGSGDLFAGGQREVCVQDVDGVVRCFRPAGGEVEFPTDRWNGDPSPEPLEASDVYDAYFAIEGPVAVLGFGGAVMMELGVGGAVGATLFYGSAIIVLGGAALALTAILGIALGDLLFGITHGDPHITTVDGVSYNYQAAGEFVYFRREGFEVQSRYLGRPGSATYSAGTAVRLGDHVIESHFDASYDVNEAGVPVIIDGVLTRLDAEGIRFEDGAVVAVEPSRTGRTVIAIAATGDFVRIENRALAQNVELGVWPDPDAPGAGLAGTANGDPDDDFTTRDGEVVPRSEISTVEGLYATFGESWRVSPGERLFTDLPADDFRTAEFLALPDMYPSLARFPLEDRIAAEEQCRQAGVPDGQALEDCAFDLLADPSGDWGAQAAEGAAAARHSGTDTAPGDARDADARQVEQAAPILLAAFQCDVEEIEALLGSGNPRDLATVREADTGRTALMYAAQEGCTDGVEALLDAGANPRYATADDGVYAAYLAAEGGHVEVLVLLLERGSPFQRSIAGGETPLLAASYFGHVGVVAELLERGANPDTGRQSDRFTPLIAASQQGHAEMVEALLDAGAQLEFTNDNGHTALLSAVAGGNPDIADLLLAAGAEVNHPRADGNTALHIASRNGDMEMMELLLAAGADPDARDGGGTVALISVALAGNAELVSLLLGAGAEPGIPRDDGVTALHFAAQEGNDAVIELLLAAGADVDVQDEDGRAPLHFAALSGFGSTVLLLLSAGADCSLQTTNGDLPVDYAGGDESITMLFDDC